MTYREEVDEVASALGRWKPLRDSVGAAANELVNELAKVVAERDAARETIGRMRQEIEERVSMLICERNAARAELAAMHARIEQSHNGYHEDGKELGLARPASHLVALGELLAEQCDIAALMARQESGDEARAELAEARRQRDEMVKACAAKDDLLVCYRIGKQPSEALFKRLDKAKKVLEAIAAEQPKRDWPEDAADTDNGSYQCRCVTCGSAFTGHKRRLVCKACAEQPKPAGGA